MIIADTNVLLRAALDDDPDQSRVARRQLAEADAVAISLQSLCEFVWVMSRSYKLDSELIANSVLNLINDEKVFCNREAAVAGLGFLLDGGDFADGVIAFEGYELGGKTFMTFDRKAASIIRAKGRDCVLLAAE
ncbi:type II toxin-antitoxin system VapC family toxin [Pseudomonas sp. R2.Fl]|nr:type II toxin-antitoxin system VapC family toxin [Pseudomonas sp. R2.Fl]